MAVAVAVITNENEDSLVQKKDMGYKPAPGCWCLFGGHVEVGENPLETLIRELTKEELIGIKPFDIKFFKKVEYFIESERRFDDLYVFHCRTKEKPSDLSLGEGAGFAFISRTEINDIKLKEPDKSLIREYYVSKGLL